MCDAQNFQNVTPAVWSCLVAKAGAYGVSIDSNSGTKTKFLAKVSWNYDPGAQTLTLQVVKTPPLMGCGKANSLMNEVVQSCMNA